MNKSQYNLHKINKFNVLLIWIFTLLLTLQAFLVTGISRGFLVLAATSGAALIASAIMLFKLNDKISSIIIPLCPAIAATALAIIEGGSLRVFILYLDTVCMAALYFSKKAIIIYGAMINIIILSTYFILDLPLVSGQLGSKEVLIQLGVTNIGIIILFFLAKWGNEYLSSASESETTAKRLLYELDETFNTIKDSASQLNDNLTEFTQYFKTVQQTNEAVTIGIHDIAKGAEEESHAISSSSIMMKEAQFKLDFTYKQSESIESLSNDVNKIACQNVDDISTLSECIKTVSNAVTKSYQTVNDLNKSMNEISNFLNSITNIAEQTNLLALNAAIEASRAGDSGKGFAVVAEEVRKLSNESNTTAAEISRIVTSLQEKTSAAIKTAKQGNDAATEGNQQVEKLNSSINNMISSFDNMKQHIDTEFKSMNEITSLFNKIDDYLVNNSAIMQEHSATTEEITATMDEQKIKVDEMLETIKGIEKLSEKLNEIANEKK